MRTFAIVVRHCASPHASKRLAWHTTRPAVFSSLFTSTFLCYVLVIVLVRVTCVVMMQYCLSTCVFHFSIDYCQFYLQLWNVACGNSDVVGATACWYARGHTLTDTGYHLLRYLQWLRGEAKVFGYSYCEIILVNSDIRSTKHCTTAWNQGH